jgi:hypothetical protein
MLQERMQRIGPVLRDLVKDDRAAENDTNHLNCPYCPGAAWIGEQVPHHDDCPIAVGRALLKECWGIRL